MINELDRFHLARAVVDRVPRLAQQREAFGRVIDHKLAEHHHYIREHGDDLPEILNWRWAALYRPS